MVERYKGNTAKKDRPQNKNLGPPVRGNDRSAGRPKGARNKVPALLKDCILKAAELEGSDRNGKDGLIGFLRQASRTHKPAFMGLLGRVLPIQIDAKIQGEMTVTGKFKGVNIKDMTLEEMQANMREMINLTRPVQKALPAPEQEEQEEVVDGEYEEVEEPQPGAKDKDA